MTYRLRWLPLALLATACGPVAETPSGADGGDGSSGPTMGATATSDGPTGGGSADPGTDTSPGP
ncbi:MAG: hypothetical protein KUG77_14085, partial [Nannocystaceae bacterium]|nr:hypothetical protein [Nannocystaceae bacterium]